MVVPLAEELAKAAYLAVVVVAEVVAKVAVVATVVVVVASWAEDQFEAD